METINSVTEQNAVQEKSVISVGQVLDQLLAALAECDDDLAARLTRSLLADESCAEVKDELTKLDEYIDDFLYDEAELLAHQLKARLRN